MKENMELCKANKRKFDKINEKYSFAKEKIWQLTPDEKLVCEKKLNLKECLDRSLTHDGK